MTIKAIVITEELDTLKIIKKFEEENSMILTLLGSALSIEEGISLIQTERPNLVFLDVVLKGDYFFELLDKLEFSIPKLIFISSDIANSIKAFKYNAIDFILKPIEFNSIIISIYKAIKMIEMERSYQEQKISAINLLNTNSMNLDYVAVSFLDKIELILMSDIIFCQADGKYTNFHLINGKK